jgi:hypothetical protein
MKILSFPFSFNPSQRNQFNTYEADGDDYKAQQVEAFMRTHKSVRPIFRDFGVEDPTFGSGRTTSGFEDTTFVSEFATFYDNITLTKVNLVGSQGALSQIQIEFT